MLLSDLRPHIVVNDDNEVTMEFWKGDKKVSIYLEPKTVLKIWGPNIFTEMKENEPNKNGIVESLEWLKS